ncbi:peptidylprolyl isomerase [Pseudanabaenaceae cyanobacterium LEGE 13415]|nr:peptidylprolyl isomerase [Pseudanabaenaceae cyanobacterium LEGE 13415]
MSTCLKIGNLALTGTQVVSALARYQLLEPFIEQIFLDSVLQTVPLTEEDVFRALTGRAGANAPVDFEAFVAEWLQQRQLSKTYLEGVIYRQLRIEKLKRLRFEQHLQSEFLRRKSEFDQVEFSLIQLSNLSLAQELFFRIRDDQAEFGALAQKYSQGMERQTQGWVGPVKLQQLPQSIVQAFVQGRVGGVYGPFAIDTHFWIVRLEQMYQARLTESVRSELRDQLFSKWLKMSARSVMQDTAKLQIVGAQTDVKASAALPEQKAS